MEPNSTNPQFDEVHQRIEAIEKAMKSTGKKMMASERCFIPRGVLHQ